jgi:hypothetical protein
MYREKYVNQKHLDDPSWPLSIIVERTDVRSDTMYIHQLMQNRLSNTTLPKIMVIIGEGDDGFNADGRGGICI